MPKYEMTYRKSDIKAFFDDNVKKSLMRNLLLMYCSGGVVVFLMMMCISLVTSLDFTLTSPVTYIFLVILAAIIALAVIRTLHSSSDKMYKEFMSVYEKDTITCTFGIDRMFIKSTGSSGSGSVMFSDLEKIVESDNYFYLFVSAEFAQIIRKSAIVEGTVEKTADLLKNAANDKYKEITRLRRDSK